MQCGIRGPYLPIVAMQTISIKERTNGIWLFIGSILIITLLMSKLYMGKPFCLLGALGIIFSFTFPMFHLVSGDCDPNDKEILLQIQASLGNPQKLVDNWQLEGGCCKSWGVECNDIGRVRYFFASFSDHPFQIPPSVGGLEYLEYMAFSDLPNLVGSIPDTVATLSHLQTLRISNCRLSGQIPSFLGQIKSLQTIDLNTNNLSGSIPSSLSQLKYLTQLALSNNKLTGPIPELRSLDPSFNKQNPLYIWLYFNNLSGTIPKSFGNISIEWLDVAGNKLTEDASFLFGHDKAIRFLCLSRNQFSFDLSNVTVPQFMEGLLINDNKIYGCIPESFNRAAFDQFDVSNNLLRGSC
ncbi:hypothetical protein Droror1_Dr00002445 [Drosera rotundifolia]